MPAKKAAVKTEGTRLPNRSSKAVKLPFRMHPRVFGALGTDLVTNDVVAIIELVKNSYDAFASRVDVQFGTDVKEEEYLEILDDGSGMDRTTIEDVWLTVATPHRKLNPVSKKGKRTRRAAGEKGLGRLSAARLGDYLEMLTKTKDGTCWLLTVDWPSLGENEQLADCYATIQEWTDAAPFSESGTRLRIFRLRSVWDVQSLDDLEENLARLRSPFENAEDFSVFLRPPDVEGKSIEVEIASPKFLSKPKYSIRGHADSSGNTKFKYRYAPVSAGSPREVSIQQSWKQIRKSLERKTKLDMKKPGCGPFDFEIRAWDIASDDTQELAEKFDLTKTNIKKAIKAHKGVSLYRDGVLVLPKSEDARDWLGLDLRRVSRVGTRLSTNQIMGYVAISADKNPRIVDKSDREGLVKSSEVFALQEILRAAVSQLENERMKDRVESKDYDSLVDLFGDLSAEKLLEDVKALSEEGGSASEALSLVKEFGDDLDSARSSIEKRLSYYSRLATIGSIAEVLVHEIRNRTTAIGSFLSYIKREYGSGENDKLIEKAGHADTAVDTLETLADRFAPLASRVFPWWKTRSRARILR